MKKILEVLSYNFIQQHYNQSMEEAENYATRLLGYDPKYAKYVSKLTGILKNLDGLKVRTIPTCIK